MMGEGSNKRDPRLFLLEGMPKNSVCAEIGVYRGDFSAKIVKIVEPRVLHLIDPWKFRTEKTYENAWYGGALGVSQANMDSIFDSVRERFKNQTRSGVISIHRAPSADVCSGFPDDYFDWIYIDGNHMYEFVKKDLESFYPKIKKDGYITGDDYHGDDHEAWWHGDIKKAVDEFVSPGVCEKVLMRNNQFILRKSADEPHAAPIGAFIRLRFFLLYVLRSRRGTRKRDSTPSGIDRAVKDTTRAA
jgi:hypothetical protein